MSAYLDASAILPMLVEEPGSALIDRFVAQTTDTLVVSDFAAAEVASALSRLARSGLLDRDDAQRRLSDFDAWRASAAMTLDLQASDVRLADIFVRRFDLMLRAPDAIHAAACRRTGSQLVTFDRRLALAAVDLGVRTEFLGTPKI